MKTPKDFSHLEGLEFIHGKQDCYTMLQVMYKTYADIELTNYARPNDWWLSGKSLYADNFMKEGFEKLDDNMKMSDFNFLDVFLIALPDNRMAHSKSMPPNHCAIYIGDGKIIHHRLGKRSQIKPYQGMLYNFTTHVIRHKDVKLFKPVTQRIDLMDHILPHKRAELQEALRNESSE